MNPRAVWGTLLAAGGLYELYALLNERDGDTLSEVTRDVFGTHTDRGRLVFTLAYTGFSVWFVPHVIAYAVEAAEDALEASPIPTPPALTRRILHRALWPTGSARR